MGRAPKKGRNGYLQEQTVILRFIWNAVCYNLLLMQAIRQRYNSLAVWFYNFYKASVTNCSTMPYFAYATRMTTTLFPKLAYQNPFE